MICQPALALEHLFQCCLWWLCFGNQAPCRFLGGAVTESVSSSHEASSLTDPLPAEVWDEPGDCAELLEQYNLETKITGRTSGTTLFVVHSKRRDGIWFFCFSFLFSGFPPSWWFMLGGNALLPAPLPGYDEWLSVKPKATSPCDSSEETSLPTWRLQKFCFKNILPNLLQGQSGFWCLFVTMMSLKLCHVWTGLKNHQVRVQL